MSTPTSKRIIQLSMSIRCWPDLVKYGVNETLEREFGEWLAPDGVEEGYDVTLVLDFARIPEEGGASCVLRLCWELRRRLAAHSIALSRARRDKRAD